MRLPEQTPVRTALTEYDRPLKMSRGARKFTWGKNITNDLSQISLDRETSVEAISDRKGWRALVKAVDGD